MEVLQEVMERLRSIVGPESWDYCVLWKPSKDQRLIEWADCCCSGSNGSHGNGGEDEQRVLFQCKDVTFNHSTKDACHLLSLLPSSMPYDHSGIYGQTMISNQPRWLNFSNSSNTDFSEDNLGTKALIPVPIGLVELFVSKQIPEDQSIIDFVTTLFNMSLEQHPILNTNNNVDSSFSVNMDNLDNEESKDYIAQVLDDQKDPNNHFQPPISPATMLENLNLSPHNISDNHLHPMNFLQQFNYSENRNGKNMFLEGTSEPMMMNHDDPFDPNSEENVGFDHEIDMALQGQMMGENMNKGHLMEPLENGAKKQGDMNRSDSVSDCSDQNDEEDDPKCRRRNGKPQSKNLMAERKRRKKLNDRLYTLRSLVPKITKLDRASILKDAIEYVMELKRQVEELQNELEENSDDEGTTNNQSTIVEQEVMHGNGSNLKRRFSHGHGMFVNGPQLEAYSGVGAIDVPKHTPDTEGANEKGQQMEPQVEVASLDGNEFYVKVFCEHKPGEFVRLMEAFNSLGLEVTNVNVTSFRCLVLNVFKVERKDSEMVQADHVRESLLEITRNPSRGWPETTTKAPENGHGMADHQLHHHHHNHNHHHNHHSHLHNHQKPQYHYNAIYQVLN
ncbi:transcription factor ABORTED MICROSPORES [Lactuca sativa]|nr:transcription factor ABORTED MICROSPORES [Lactuca sativa]